MLHTRSVSNAAHAARAAKRSKKTLTRDLVLSVRYRTSDPSLQSKLRVAAMQQGKRLDDFLGEILAQAVLSFSKHSGGNS